VDTLFLQLQDAVAAESGPLHKAVERFHKLLPHDDDSIVFLGALNLFRECVCLSLANRQNVTNV
jgi:hypothetical protein